VQIENGRQPMGREVCVAYTALVSDLIPLRGDRTEQRVKKKRKHRGRGDDGSEERKRAHKYDAPSAREESS